jgi:DNA-directed RNA polymerase subunit RPC12/RpoP
MYDDNRAIFYIGCPDCKKKVLEEGAGKYRCENCNKIVLNCTTNYNFSARFSDFTGS